MAYPYDSDGELTEQTKEEMFGVLSNIYSVQGIDWESGRGMFFEWAHEQYPMVSDSDLWDEWRDYYERVTG